MLLQTCFSRRGDTMPTNGPSLTAKNCIIRETENKVFFFFFFPFLSSSGVVCCFRYYRADQSQRGSVTAKVSHESTTLPDVPTTCRLHSIFLEVGKSCLQVAQRSAHQQVAAIRHSSTSNIKVQNEQMSPLVEAQQPHM